MEPNFQTSFIPKKPMIEERAISSRPIGIFMVAALFILFAMIIGSGGLYFYKGILNKSIEGKKTELDLAKGRFEPAKIAQLQVLDKRLKASTLILEKHVAISPIFEALQKITLPSVRYTRFTYDFEPNANSKVAVKIGGLAVGYRSVALQADLFTKNKNIIDPVFSNLVLDEKGNVLFNLDFDVEPTFVSYREMLGGGEDEEDVEESIEEDISQVEIPESTEEGTTSEGPAELDSSLDSSINEIDEIDLNL